MTRSGVFFVASVVSTEGSLPEFTQRLFSESAVRASELRSEFYESDGDLVWENNPRQWHQQAARIVDHRFTSFAELEAFAYDAKKAGVSVLNLVEIQKTKSCPGPWYNGLQLCDHINGSYPVPDGSLEKWQQMVQNIKPMRLMWWINAAYWSVQGEVWQQAEADRSSDVGKWFSWDATDADECYGSNPDGAQGSWGSEGANSGIQSALASFCSESYADYMVDALANSWTGNLAIDGYTLDISANYNPGECGNHGMLQCPNGDGYSGWGKIMAQVREKQPQVVQSGEGYGSWNEMIEVEADIGGQGFGGYHDTMRAAILEGDVSELESAASTSGADAASVVCYLHPGYDGKQPGGCPTMYFRDQTAVIRDLKQHQMWVSLEAAAGIVPQHDYDPDSYCFDGDGQFSGCYEDSNPGAWWNVTSDPFDEQESPLWAFSKYRALNRLALRTNLEVSVSRASLSSLPAGSSSPMDDYITYEHQNAYDNNGGTEIDSRPVKHMSAEQCAQRCSDDVSCDCVVFAESQQGSCWKRGHCDPVRFENDGNTDPYTVFVKKERPAPPTAGAVAYLKHDAMGPAGDAAILVFNPGAAANITIDLSMLPSSILGVVPQDLLGSTPSSTPPLSASWTVEMEARGMKFFSGFSLGVFAPRQGKRSSCLADDQYSKKATSSTLQGCFLECLADPQCGNVFVEYVDINYMETPPATTCTLLGTVKDPSASCTEGTGTLVKKLPGARSCAHLWDGESPPAALGAAPVQPGPSSPACGAEIVV